MDESGAWNKWGWGVLAPIALVATASIWIFAGEVRLSGRSGETIYTGWGLWACAAVPFFFGVRLHAQHFWEPRDASAGWAAVVAMLSGWLAGAGLVGCLLWVAMKMGG